MKFTPKTEEEIQESSLWQPGVYDFEIITGSTVKRLFEGTITMHPEVTR